MKYELQRNIDQFKATGNPIYAWWAYRRARQLGEPIPPEILEHFDGIAEAILTIASGPPADPKKRPIDIAKGLGLHTSQPFNDYRKDQKYVRFLALVEDSLSTWLEKYGEKRGWADSELRVLAKQAGIGKSTADDLLQKHFERQRKAANTHLSSTSRE